MLCNDICRPCNVTFELCTIGFSSCNLTFRVVLSVYRKSMPSHGQAIAYLVTQCLSAKGGRGTKQSHIYQQIASLRSQWRAVDYWSHAFDHWTFTVPDPIYTSRIA
jgi:hypothetical protein